jgi:hypothetical protein
MTDDVNVTASIGNNDDVKNFISEKDVKRFRIKSRAIVATSESTIAIIITEYAGQPSFNAT